MTQKIIADWLQQRNLSYAIGTREGQHGKRFEFTLQLAVDVSDWCHEFGTQIDYTIHSHKEERGWWVTCPVPDYKVS